jgi:hypothetical protein
MGSFNSKQTGFTKVNIEFTGTLMYENTLDPWFGITDVVVVNVEEQLGGDWELLDGEEEGG